MQQNVHALIPLHSTYYPLCFLFKLIYHFNDDHIDDFGPGADATEDKTALAQRMIVTLMRLQLKTFQVKICLVTRTCFWSADKQTEDE